MLGKDIGKIIAVHYSADKNVSDFGGGLYAIRGEGGLAQQRP